MQYQTAKLSLSLTVCGLMGMTILGCQTPGLEQGIASSANQDHKLSSQEDQVKPSHATQTVTFNIDPSWGFKTQQAQPAYVKVKVHKGTEAYYPENSGTGGLITVPNPGNSVSVAINVPEGKHWIVDVDFLYTPDSEPVKTLKSQFSVPTMGDVPVNVDTYLMASVIENLYQINPTLLAQFTEQKEQELKAYLDALTGFQRDPGSGNVSYTRLNTELQTQPQDVSARQIALEISAGLITPIQQTGALTPPINYLQTPALRGSTKLSAGQAPVLPLAINSLNQHLFFNPVTGSNSELYSVIVDEQSTSTNGFFQHQLGNTNGSLNLQQGLVLNGKLDKLPFLALGSANPSGNSLVNAAYLVEFSTTDYPTLKALNPSNGSTLWSYNFDRGTGPVQAFSTLQYFPPIVKHLKGNDPNCQCDDDNLIIFTVASLDSSKQGIYAVKQKRPGGIGTAAETTGETVWFYNQSGAYPTQYGAALSPDQESLYFIERVSENGVLQHYLSALDTTTGQKKFSTALAGVANTSTPSVGKNGTIYQTMNDNGDSKIYAINPVTGNITWTRSILDRINMSPIVDHQNNEDVLYLWSWISGKMYAYSGSNVAKWTTPLTVLTRKAGEDFSFASYPVLGEMPGGGRMLYVAANKQTSTSLVSSKLYAIQDNGSSGAVSWSFSPGGTIVANGGFNSPVLDKNHLYLGTRDGGDGQFVNLRAVKVEASKMPDSAPWPRLGGNQRNQNAPATQP